MVWKIHMNVLKDPGVSIFSIEEWAKWGKNIPNIGKERSGLRLWGNPFSTIIYNILLHNFLLIYEHVHKIYNELLSYLWFSLFRSHSTATSSLGTCGQQRKQSSCSSNWQNVVPAFRTKEQHILVPQNKDTPEKYKQNVIKGKKYINCRSVSCFLLRKGNYKYQNDKMVTLKWSHA
jgi:hypothetical protein